MQRPRTLPCGHSFCTPCIDKLKELGYVTCPECRDCHVVPEGGEFPVSYIAEALMRAMRDAKVAALASLPPSTRKRKRAARPAGKNKVARLSKKMCSFLEEQEATVMDAIAACQEVESQLDQYRTTLTDWSEQQQQLKDRLQGLMEQNGSAKEIVELEKSRVAAKEREVKKGKKELQAVLETYAPATDQEAGMAVTEMVRCLGEAEQVVEECREGFPDASAVTNVWKVRVASSAAIEAAQAVLLALETATKEEPHPQPHPEEPSAQSDPEEARAQSDPEETRPQSDPEEARPQSDPEEARAQSDPEEARAQSDPEEARPQSDPEEARPQSDPEEARAQSDPEATSAQSDPEEARAQSDPEATSTQSDPEEARAQSDPEATSAQSDPEEARAQSDPEATSAQSDPEATSAQSDPEATSAQSDPEEARAQSDPEGTSAQSDPEEARAQSDPEATSAQSDPEATSAQSDPEEATRALLNPEATSAQSDPEEARAQSDPEEARAQSDPEEARAQSDPEEARAQSDPEEARAQSDPEEARAQSDPEEARAQSDPEEARAQSDPEEARAQSDPEATIAQSDPEEARAQSDPEATSAQSDPEEARAQSDPEEARAQSDPEEARAQSDLEEASALSDSEEVNPDSTIMDRLQLILTLSLKAKDLRSLTQPTRSLLQAGLVFAVHQLEGQRQYARISLEAGRLYLHALKEQPLPLGASTLQVSEVVPSYPPCTVFLDLSMPGSVTRRVQIRLNPNTALGRCVLLLCTGQCGHSYRNTCLLGGVRKGGPGECVIAGGYKKNDGTGSSMHLPDQNYGEYRRSGQPGDVSGMRVQDDTRMRGLFAIFTKIGRVSPCVFGEVVEGLPVLIEASQLGNIKEVTVVDCGVVL
ncbi:neurofilament heavy polypeptide-like [Eriocheir sinensis]|uniref:neurofilament heavy polypeptide-like n=1 Tax=Eriocheir sinensis TaxID=95602 RepID=UPI0021C7ADE9|nr:neurofilament heavy polypeptide-like [Eriocheir sinensis]